MSGGAGCLNNAQAGGGPAQRNGRRTLLWTDQLKGVASVVDCPDRDTLIECCQLAAFMGGQSQKIDVGDLGMSNDYFGIEDVSNTKVFRPEMVA